MAKITLISGSPTAFSRTESVLHYLGSLLEKEQFTVTHISVRDVDPADLLFANFNSPVIKSFAEQIQDADGVIVGSPVYKVEYSGVLKALFDLLPEDVLEHTPVLPLMIGGSSSHLLAMEYALKPLLASLKAHNLKGLYFLESQIDKHAEMPIIDVTILERTRKQLYYFIETIKSGRLSNVN
jgi:FMN reductase